MTREAVADSNRFFALPALSIGQYKVTATKEGIKATTLDGVILRTATRERLL